MRLLLRKTALSSFLIISLAFQAIACTGGANDQGSLTPTSGYQTIATADGYYYSINVTCGNTYNFDFCANGGSSGSLFPEISVLDATGTTEYAFSPYSGGCSQLTWVASFTGTIRLLITDDGCGTSESFSATLAYNETTGGAIDASFTLSAVCGGGTATITGTPGGTFTFNPAPGDGAQVNASTGSVTNGSAGTTYSVQYTICGTSSTESVAVVNDNCFTLNGSAQYITVGGDECIQLTDEINDQTGCAWSSSQIDFNSDFTLSLDYYFGDNINGADGNTFTFQPSSSTACGQSGEQLGAGGIPNALIVEFDTYDNDNPAHVYDMLCDHVSIEMDGDMTNAAPMCGPVCAKSGGGNIDDGGVYTVDIDWNSTTQTLSVYFDGVFRLSCTNDFVTNLFGGQNQVYWGATSATGGLNNQQYFCPSTIILLPVEMASFTSECNGSTEVFKWSTNSEDRLNHFQLEYTYDGLVFYPEKTVDATGMSQAMQHYSTQVQFEDHKQRYYRLKLVDESGEYTYTDLISSKQCKRKNAILSAVSQLDGRVYISTYEPAEITVLNAIGQTIFVGTTDNNTVQFDSQSAESGVYFVIARNQSGQQESEKLRLNN